MYKLEMPEMANRPGLARWSSIPNTGRRMVYPIPPLLSPCLSKYVSRSSEHDGWIIFSGQTNIRCSSTTPRCRARRDVNPSFLRHMPSAVSCMDGPSTCRSSPWKSKNGQQTHLRIQSRCQLSRNPMNSLRLLRLTFDLKTGMGLNLSKVLGSSFKPLAGISTICVSMWS
jgi:hypothetical protein